MLLPLPSFAVPQRYPTETRAESYKAFREDVSLTDLGFDKIALAAAPDVWVVGCKDHTDYFGVARNFQSAVRGLVIAISSENGLQVCRTPAQRLTCE